VRQIEAVLLFYWVQIGEDNHDGMGIKPEVHEDSGTVKNEGKQIKVD
jgi:hypothetical protein